MRCNWVSKSFFKFALMGLVALAASPVYATQIGEIYACYECMNTGNSAIDSALAANPNVSASGLLLAFVNNSSTAITGGVLSVFNAFPTDSFTLPSIAANSTFILIPGVTDDGGTHPFNGLFSLTGVKDTNGGEGGVSDASVFQFTATQPDGNPIFSTTAGTSTLYAGTFTPGDPGLARPYFGNPAEGSTSFIGDGPNGVGGCTNCYFGEVATINITPEPASSVLFLAGIGVLASFTRRARRIMKACKTF